MKFQIKYPDAELKDRFEFEYSYVTKTPALGACQWCGSMTRWIDVMFAVPVCGEECGGAMWARYRTDQEAESKYEDFEKHFERVKEELEIAQRCPADVTKDIIIVVRDQLPYVKECLGSIEEQTQGHHIYLWDNDSQQDTADYLQEFLQARSDRVSLMTYNENVGFIHPNNELAGWGDSDYIILLNSDCKVFEHWDRAMIGFLREHSDVAQVGYWGGHMDAEGRGFGGAYGGVIDYVPGWCFCISRDTYKKYGLFDHGLKFAYCEDADLSLRLKEAGLGIYALHPSLVHHYQNKTIQEVKREGKIDVHATFQHNHQWMQKRWAKYIKEGRVLLDSSESHPPIL